MKQKQKNVLTLLIPLLMLLTISISISILPSISALDIGVYPSTAIQTPYKYIIYNGIDIKNPCYNNGTYCSATTTCNITIYNPNNAVIVDNQAMTYQTSYYNYTLQGNNQSIGLYKSDMICTDGSVSGAQSFFIEVITGGNLSLFTILAIASFLIFIAAFLMQNEYLGFVAGALFIITGLYSIIFGVANLANMYTDTIGYVSLGLGIMFLAAAGYSAAAGSGLFSGKDGGYEDSLSDDVWGRP